MPHLDDQLLPRFERRSYRLALLALWGQGCLTFFVLQYLVGYCLGMAEGLFHGMNLKLPWVTKLVLSVSPLLSQGGTAVVLSIFWTMALLGLLRWRPIAAASEEELTTMRLELAFAMHLVLNSLMIAMGIAVAIPFMQLLGCL